MFDKVKNVMYLNKTLLFSIFISITYFIVRAFIDLLPLLIDGYINHLINMSIALVPILIALLAIFLVIPFSDRVKAFIKHKRYDKIISISIMENIIISLTAAFLLLFSKNNTIAYIGTYFSFLSLIMLILIARDFFILARNFNK